MCVFMGSWREFGTFLLICWENKHTIKKNTPIAQTRTRERNDAVAVQHNEYGSSYMTNSLILTFNLWNFLLTFRNEVTETCGQFSQSIYYVDILKGKNPS